MRQTRDRGHAGLRALAPGLLAAGALELHGRPGRLLGGIVVLDSVDFVEEPAVGALAVLVVHVMPKALLADLSDIK